METESHPREFEELFPREFARKDGWIDEGLGVLNELIGVWVERVLNVQLIEVAKEFRIDARGRRAEFGEWELSEKRWMEGATSRIISFKS